MPRQNRMSEIDVVAVPFVDLRAQLPVIREEIRQAIDQVMASTCFTNGPRVAKFEGDFAAYCQVSECVAVNSGTSALHLAMRCLDIGPGDEVITVSMSFVATAWPILYLSARPVFVDVDPERYTMDPAQLEAAITGRTKAIVPVHLYGQCADMDPILEIARAHGIPVIEDAAQAHGATHRGRRAGSMGTIGCFSFYPGKNLGAFGEGGALCTNDPVVAARARMLRDHGQRQRYVHETVGYNYRMEEFQAAILGIKLSHLDAWTLQRQAVAAEYDLLLADCDVVHPVAAPDGKHVYHLYVIRSKRRDDLRAVLQEHNVATGLHYPIPIHLQEPFRAAGYGEGSLPVAEEVARTCLSLPMYSELTGRQIHKVVTVIESFTGEPVEGASGRQHQTAEANGAERQPVLAK